MTEVAIKAIEFCSNGKYLAVGCSDGVTSIIDVDR